MQLCKKRPTKSLGSLVQICLIRALKKRLLFDGDGSSAGGLDKLLQNLVRVFMLHINRLLFSILEAYAEGCGDACVLLEGCCKLAVDADAEGRVVELDLGQVELPELARAHVSVFVLVLEREVDGGDGRRDADGAGAPGNGVEAGQLAREAGFGKRGGHDEMCVCVCVVVVVVGGVCVASTICK